MPKRLCTDFVAEKGGWSYTQRGLIRGILWQLRTNDLWCLVVLKSAPWAQNKTNKGRLFEQTPPWQCFVAMPLRFWCSGRLSEPARWLHSLWPMADSCLVLVSYTWRRLPRMNEFSTLKGGSQGFTFALRLTHCFIGHNLIGSWPVWQYPVGHTANLSQIWIL